MPAAGSKYPFVLCTSVNDEIVHGMPSQKRALKKGDIVSIDTGVSLDGYFGDSAITVPVGEVDRDGQQAVEGHRESLELAIEQMRPGNRLFDICGDGREARDLERVFDGPGVCRARHRDQPA